MLAWRNLPPPIGVKDEENPMKRGLVTGLLWLLVPFLAVAQDSTKIIAMENLWNRAELDNDAPAVRLLLADDFVMTTAEGTLYNKTQIVDSVADKSYRPEALQSSGLVVHSYGNTAIVTGALYEKGVDKGKPWERRGRFTDTWLNMGGRWQCIASHFSVKPK
jgi:ketosteroid isomerase-like protein